MPPQAKTIEVLSRLPQIYSLKYCNHAITNFFHHILHLLSKQNDKLVLLKPDTTKFWYIIKHPCVTTVLTPLNFRTLLNSLVSPQTDTTKFWHTKNSPVSSQSNTKEIYRTLHLLVSQQTDVTEI